MTTPKPELSVDDAVKASNRAMSHLFDTVDKYSVSAEGTVLVYRAITDYIKADHLRIMALIRHTSEHPKTGG